MHYQIKIWIALAVLSTPGAALAFEAPSPDAVSTFNAYTAKIESRLAEQQRTLDRFLGGMNSQTETRLRSGEIIVERLTPADGTSAPGAMLHHWRGTAFVAGAKAEDFDRLLRNFDGYPKTFAPQVVAAKVISHNGDRMQASMRVKQKHLLTVVMDTNYDIAFGRLDEQHRYSHSRSTRIAEIDSPGTPSERPMSDSEAHGFLWRLNTYWSYEERDGGLYMQIESASLTRSIPRGLGWAVGPFVESVPRESLEFTLRAAAHALH
jgi:hypothetical protein